MLNKVKVWTTLNGVAFDTPTSINLKKASNEINSCRMVFPRRLGSRYRATKKDIFRLYVGYDFDTRPPYPVFTGYMEYESGFGETDIQLYGIMGRAMKDFVIINDTYNFDRCETGNAIFTVLKTIDSLSYSKFAISQTSPPVLIPDDTRIDRGISKWDLIRQFTSMSKDVSNMRVRNYSLFEMGNDIYFRKEPDTINGHPDIILHYGKKLVDFSETNSDDPSINKIRVIGKDVSAVFQNDCRIRVDGLREGEPINDNTILTTSECFDISRNAVQSGLFDNFGVEIESPALLNATPGASMVAIKDAPYGLNGNYILRELNMDISHDDITIRGVMDNPTKHLGDIISTLLGINRSIYPGS